MTNDWNQAKTNLAAGGKVLFTPDPKDLDNTCPPLSNIPVFWNRVMNPKLDAMLGLWINVKHPAMAGFPTEAFCDWQWTDVVNKMRTVNLDKAPRELKPIVQAIDDWNRNYRLAVVFECNVGQGRLLVCAPEIQRDVDKHTVARQLRRSLLDYMASEKFKPLATLTVAQANALWPGRNGGGVQGAQPQMNTSPDINEGPNAVQRVR